ncbi:hypothetical protein Ciccas_002841 [Cichlidogyrus casuarinus]|uniref:Uncharacterized protein n=1 Tax=Cichlidogyrus casuarinus TaxID=1844966 RepID=A0ABD2QG55_9PLAT
MTDELGSEMKQEMSHLIETLEQEASRSWISKIKDVLFGNNYENSLRQCATAIRGLMSKLDSQQRARALQTQTSKAKWKTDLAVLKFDKDALELELLRLLSLVEKLTCQLEEEKKEAAALVMDKQQAERQFEENRCQSAKKILELEEELIQLRQQEASPTELMAQKQRLVRYKT